MLRTLSNLTSIEERQKFEQECESIVQCGLTRYYKAYAIVLALLSVPIAHLVSPQIYSQPPHEHHRGDSKSFLTIAPTTSTPLLDFNVQFLLGFVNIT